MLACERGFEMTVEILLNINGSVNTEIHHDITALMLAVQYSKNIKIVQLLLSAGADFNHVDKKGNTVLDYALASDNPEITQLLLLHMCDTSHQQNNIGSMFK